MYVMAGDGSQLSVAVAVPVLAGKDDASQWIVMFDGHIITGVVVSIITPTTILSRGVVHPLPALEIITL
jgi:hypothetical protein